MTSDSNKQSQTTKKTSPFFSIITVVLNDRKGFKKTRDSLFIQTFENFEWIVIDGGSSDGTVQEIQHSPKTVQLNYVSEPDDGIYDGMNKGSQRSSGKYLLFLNAGDELFDKHTLKLVYNSISSLKTNPAIVFGGAFLIFSKTYKHYRAPRMAKNSIWHGNPANHQATYFHHDWVKRYPYDLQYRVCSDYYLIAKIISQNPSIAYVHKPLSKFGVGGFTFQHPIITMLEPAKVQRCVLGSPTHLIFVSLLKRLIATLGTAVLQKFPLLRINFQKRH